MRATEEHTGIFIRKTTTPEGWKESKKAMLALVKQDFLQELKEWESEALRILRKNGFKKFPGNLPDSAPLAARDAVELMYELWGTRDFIKRNDALTAAKCAFKAGHISTRMEIRPHEKSAVIGRKAKEGGERGRQSQGRRYNDAAINHKLWLEYASEAQKLYIARYGEPLSQRKMATAVSKHFKVNYWTVLSALKNNKKS